MSPGVVDDDEDEAGFGFPRSTASSSTELGGMYCGTDAVSISPVFAPEDGCAFALALGCRGCCPCLGGGSCANVLSNLQPAVCVCRPCLGCGFRNFDSDNLQDGHVHSSETTCGGTRHGGTLVCLGLVLLRLEWQASHPEPAVGSFDHPG